MATPVVPVTTAPAPKESELQKIWGWIEGEVVHVENGIEDFFGPDAAAKIQAAGKALLSSSMGPVIVSALADATNVLTGQMSVSKAVASLVSQFEAAGKSLTEAAALQVIGVAQNALPAKPATVTPVA